MLIEARILEKVSSSYRFMYPYIYYYFVARYLANNIAASQIREQVSKMCRRLFIEEFANIIMFLTHLSKDPFILEEVLASARIIFSELSPAELDGDIQIINNLIEELPAIVLQNIEVIEAREKKLKEQDEIEEIIQEEYHDIIKSSDGYDLNSDINEIDISAKLNLAVKTIEIIGQILRNFYGSIKGVQKKQLCEEGYNIGLRSISFLFSTIDDSTETLVEKIIKDSIKENGDTHYLEDEDNVKTLARKLIFDLCTMFTFGFIVNVSSSLGTQNLNATFRKILEEDPTVGKELIDIAIKLDHYHDLPISNIEILYNKLRKTNNFLGIGLLKQFVLRYLYLFEVSHSEKQRICSILGISLKSQRRILQASIQRKSIGVR